MPNNLPASPDPNWFSEWVSSGKIPGAVKAIAQLVGGSADAVSSWIGIAKVKGEQIQQGIKDETAAKSVVTSALAKAAAKQGISDEALVERAVEQWAGKRLRSQSNREDIARRTIEYVSEGEPIADHIQSPTGDWLNIFERHAEDANSEKLRDLWARVLAGEIRKPGAFSFATMHFLSVLDENLAKVAENVLSKAVNDKHIWYSEDHIQGEILEEFSTLSDHGLIRFLNLNTAGRSDDDGNYFARFKQNVLIAKFKPNHLVVHTAAQISPVGREVLSIINPIDNEYQIEYMIRELKNLGAKEILIAKYDKDNLFIDRETLHKVM